MEKVSKIGYFDICCLSELECINNDFSYPTYLVFFESEETGIDKGIYESAHDCYISAYEWCINKSR